MEIELNNTFLGEFLLSNDCREMVGSIANNAEMLYQAQVAKRTGRTAASAHAHTEIGGVENDRWIGVMSVGEHGARGAPGDVAAHEYGAGDHPGSTGRHHNRAADDMNRVLEELEGL
ncbi:hypothetical protein [Mycobacterium malmoense]|uniref:hypothetical protein n=1 Tax=Mycobacterium malmoense TaxID=1780 RepID=UPI0008F82C7E|nr:hypothetical protein [Mycobacterium malmoense]OIN80871.1 hypothetical protein BMG05_11090 [Mycobacterium malmoense]